MYNKTNWQSGDIISADKLNKIEETLYQINEEHIELTINDDETVQDAINRAVSSNATLNLKNKRYNLSSALTIDLSNCCIKGNGAIFDFSSAPNNLECITITGTGSKPYYQNANYIEKIEIIGNRTNTGAEEGEHCSSRQTAIVCAGTTMDKSASHLNLRDLNIHNFYKGLEFRTYCYLVRIQSTDIFYCDYCIEAPDGGEDYGENFSFNNCCLYNSLYGILNNNKYASIFFNNCSIDYNAYQISNNESTPINLVNCHIEGYGKFKGNMNFTQCHMAFTNVENIFNTENSASINFDMCSIAVPQCSVQMVETGNGIVNFNNCIHPAVTSIVDCDLNDNSSSMMKKQIELFVQDSNWTRNGLFDCSSGTINRDNEVKEIDDWSYKISKTTATNETGLYLFMMLHKKSLNPSKVRIKLRTRTNTNNVTIPMELYACNKRQHPHQEGWDYEALIGQTLANTYDVIGQSWKTMHIVTAQETKNCSFSEYYLVVFNLSNLNNGECFWIDSVQMFEY